MTPLQSHRTDSGDLSFDASSCSWINTVELVSVAGETGERRTGSGESLLVVLGGTFDLFAGGGSWLRRGLRSAPWEPGRPVALFLPPNTPWQAREGEGQLLLVSSAQPAPPAPPPEETAEDAKPARKKPLLQIAGSGKAFDSASQSWKPKESFLESPEALLPRRFARLEAGDVTAERIAEASYKALSLRVDEAVLSADQTLAPPQPEGPAPAEGLAIVVPGPGAHVRCGEATFTTPTVLHFPLGTEDTEDTDRLPALRTEGGPCQVTLAYAGPKHG